MSGRSTPGDHATALFVLVRQGSAMLEYTRTSMHSTAYNYISTVWLECPQRILKFLRGLLKWPKRRR